MSAHPKPSFYNPCVFEQAGFVVEQREEFIFAVLEPNPDAGKSGVCYAGKHLTVCTTDGLEEATRIAKGLALLAQQDAA